ncbi:hypothetical protein [Shinella sp.]|uniref:hypothetical protein n=1 Tax=Shinella sp. TaxID=1870904 RepID=UPI0028ACAD8E|nr:hypothetical protein [Shinella sp.]
MNVFETLHGIWERYRQKRTEREALRMLITRGDRRLLRDVGLDLVEGNRPGCEPLPQTKERRWTAPLIRLPSPSARKRSEGDGAAVSSSNRPAA